MCLWVLSGHYEPDLCVFTALSPMLDIKHRLQSLLILSLLLDNKYVVQFQNNKKSFPLRRHQPECRFQSLQEFYFSIYKVRA